MFGNFDLRFLQDFLKMTNAQRSLRQQMKNAQARRIAEALINLNQVHRLLAAARHRALLTLALSATASLPGKTGRVLLT